MLPNLMPPTLCHSPIDDQPSPPEDRLRGHEESNQSVALVTQIPDVERNDRKSDERSPNRACESGDEIAADPHGRLAMRVLAEATSTARVHARL